MGRKQERKSQLQIETQRAKGGFGPPFPHQISTKYTTKISDFDLSQETH
jgi:hypothetical protein